MTMTSLYPVLMSRQVTETAAFYRDTLDLTVTYEAGDYVSMRSGAFELAILAHDHHSIPAGYHMVPAGLILNFEVDDVDPLHQRLAGRPEVTIVQVLRDEPFGQRHFIVGAPEGVLLDIIQPIEPAAAFAANFTADA